MKYCLTLSERNITRNLNIFTKNLTNSMLKTHMNTWHIDEEYSCHDVMCTSFPILAFGLFFDVAVIGFNTEENLFELEDKGVCI